MNNPPKGKVQFGSVVLHDYQLAFFQKAGAGTLTITDSTGALVTTLENAKLVESPAVLTEEQQARLNWLRELVLGENPDEQSFAE